MLFVKEMHVINNVKVRLKVRIIWQESKVLIYQRINELSMRLTYLFGIGLKTSQDILNKLKIDFNKRVKDLTDAEVAAIFQKKFPVTILLKVNCAKKLR